jgi:hypothetical protein
MFEARHVKPQVCRLGSCEPRDGPQRAYACLVAVRPFDLSRALDRVGNQRRRKTAIGIVANGLLQRDLPTPTNGTEIDAEPGDSRADRAVFPLRRRLEDGRLFISSLALKIGWLRARREPGTSTEYARQAGVVRRPRPRCCPHTANQSKCGIPSARTPASRHSGRSTSSSSTSLATADESVTLLCWNPLERSEVQPRPETRLQIERS